MNDETGHPGTPGSAHKLVVLIVLLIFFAVFAVLDFLAGWGVRRSEDLYNEAHQQNVAQQAAEKAAYRAAAITEQQIKRDLGLAGKPCNPGK